LEVSSRSPFSVPGSSLTDSRGAIYLKEGQQTYIWTGILWFEVEPAYFALFLGLTGHGFGGDGDEGKFLLIGGMNRYGGGENCSR